MTRPARERARAGLSRHVAHNIERIADLHARAEEGAGGHQRFVEWLASFVGRPAFFYAVVLGCAGSVEVTARAAGSSGGRR